MNRQDAESAKVGGCVTLEIALLLSSFLKAELTPHLLLEGPNCEPLG